MKGTIKAICTSPAKGTVKRPVDKAVFKENYGIEGDAHAGPWHRQVSLLSYDKVVEFNNLGGQVEDGDFGENLLVTDIDFRSLPIGTIFIIGDVKLRITQIGKECHSHCEIYKRVGTCIMPHEGVFAEVLEGGTVFPGDTLEVVDFKE